MIERLRQAKKSMGLNFGSDTLVSFRKACGSPTDVYGRSLHCGDEKIYLQKPVLASLAADVR